MLLLSFLGYSYLITKKKRKGGMTMYAVKVLHGYISKDGQRTRDKRRARIFINKNYAEKFADKIGGRVKEMY
jgi:hypothetical protein